MPGPDMKLMMQLKAANTALVKQAESASKNQQVMLTLAMYYADVVAEYRVKDAKAEGLVAVDGKSPNTLPHLPMFPHFIPDADFKAVWARMVGGEGMGISVGETGVTVHRVKPEMVDPVQLDAN